MKSTQHRVLKRLYKTLEESKVNYHKEVKGHRCNKGSIIKWRGETLLLRDNVDTLHYESQRKVITSNYIIILFDVFTHTHTQF